MASTTLVVAIVSLLFASLSFHGDGVSAAALAQSPAPETAVLAPSPADDGCLMALTNMSDCLTFVEDGSKLTKPDKGCCPELAGLIDGNPICLCKLLGGNAADSIGIKININKALKLPTICGVTTPPVSACSAIGVPVSLPPSLSGDAMSPNMAMSPKGLAPSPSTSSDSSGVLSPSGSKIGGASSIQASALTFIFALSTVSVSIFF